MTVDLIHVAQLQPSWVDMVTTTFYITVTTTSNWHGNYHIHLAVINFKYQVPSSVDTVTTTFYSTVPSSYHL